MASSAVPPTLSMPDEMEVDTAPSGYIVPEAIRKKYGRYPPWCRLNVDQVPLPFVNAMDVTYAERGATRVVINQLGPALSKRQATGQLCFRPMVPRPAGCTSDEARALYKKHLQQQPAPCIIFRGQGNISEDELNDYPEEVVVLWQQEKACGSTAQWPGSGSRTRCSHLWNRSARREWRRRTHAT